VSRVDVVVPSYRYAHFLRDCVYSVLTQEGVDVRVLIIDDCSPDNTQQVCEQLVAEDARVAFRRHAINRGHIATYNEGLLEWASRDYCLLLSADDMLMPGALKRASRLMDEHPAVGFVHGRAIKAGGISDRPAEPCAYRVSIEAGEAFIRSVCQTGVNPVDTPTVVVRTSLQHGVGGYLASLPHLGDLEMWLRLATMASVGYVDAYQALYRRHEGNMSLERHATRDLRDFRETIAVFDSLFHNQGRRLPALHELSSAVNRTLLRQALGGADEAFGARQPSACRDFLTLAQRLDPDIRGSRLLRIWARMRLKRLLGPGILSVLRPLVERFGLAQSRSSRTHAWTR
jgi:glycosyltransferase involved in cell wall biosynthesis